MTKEQVIAAARDLMIREARAVKLEPEAVRPMQADRFNALFGRSVYSCDFWIVEFRKTLPPGVAFESPGTIIVEVIPDNCQIREVHIGMHLGQ